MLAEYGTLSLAEVLAPAIEMADGYPIEARDSPNRIEREQGAPQAVAVLARVLLPHPGEAREAPRAGEIFRQPDLAATLRKLVDAETRGAQGAASRARTRSWPRTTASTGRHRAGVRARRAEQGGLFTRDDLAQLEGEDRGAASARTTRASRSTS